MFNYRNQRLDIAELEIDFCFITNIQGNYVEPCVIVIIGNLLFSIYASELIEVIITMQKSMFEIKCSEWGKTALISFKPTVGKQGYGKTCFFRHMFKQSESVGRSSSFDSRQALARRRDNGQGERRRAH
jgi:hypothetical protein